METPDFSEVVALICKEDPRFDRKAYEFVRLGLDHTVKEIQKRDATRVGRSRHVSGPELLHGLRVYALDQFGPLTKTVLNAWGIHRCADFGEIVFNLIEYNMFSKTDQDRQGYGDGDRQADGEAAPPGDVTRHGGVQRPWRSEERRVGKECR